MEKKDKKRRKKYTESESLILFNLLGNAGARVCLAIWSAHRYELISAVTWQTSVAPSLLLCHFRRHALALRADLCTSKAHTQVAVYVEVTAMLWLKRDI